MRQIQPLIAQATSKKLPYIGPRFHIAGADRRDLAELVGRAFIERSPMVSIPDLMEELGRSFKFVLNLLEESGVDFRQRASLANLPLYSEVDTFDSVALRAYIREIAEALKSDHSISLHMLASAIRASPTDVQHLWKNARGNQRFKGRRLIPPSPDQEKKKEDLHAVALKMKERYLREDWPSVREVAVMFGYSMRTTLKLLHSVDTPMRGSNDARIALARQQRIRSVEGAKVSKAAQSTYR